MYCGKLNYIDVEDKDSIDFERFIVDHGNEIKFEAITTWTYSLKGSLVTERYKINAAAKYENGVYVTKNANSFEWDFSKGKYVNDEAYPCKVEFKVDEVGGGIYVEGVWIEDEETYKFDGYLN